MAKAMTQYKRTRIFKRDYCICQICGKYPGRVDFFTDKNGNMGLRLIDPKHIFPFVIDHIIPYSLFQMNGDTNLQTACWPCNSKKGNKYEMV